MSKEHIMYGKIYLIPSEMGEQTPTRLFPKYNLEIIKTVSHFIVENARTSRRFIKKVCPEVIIDTLTICELDKHTPDSSIRQMIEPALQGNDIGILSEAGMPCIADPGNLIVEKAHELGIQVIPLIGPNSIIMALIASGFNGQNFVFHGYIPIKENRNQTILAMEAISFKTGQTQIFMETPYRNQKLFEDLIQILKPDTKLCIATNITLDNENIKTLSIKDWKKNTPQIHKQPTIFLIQ